MRRWATVGLGLAALGAALIATACEGDSPEPPPVVEGVESPNPRGERRHAAPLPVVALDPDVQAIVDELIASGGTMPWERQYEFQELVVAQGPRALPALLALLDGGYEFDHTLACVLAGFREDVIGPLCDRLADCDAAKPRARSCTCWRNSGRSGRGDRDATRSLAC